MKARARKLAWMLSAAMVFTTVNSGMAAMASEEQEVVEYGTDETTEGSSDSTAEEETVEPEMQEGSLENEAENDGEIVEDITVAEVEDGEEQLLMAEEAQEEKGAEAVTANAEKSWSVVGEKSYTMEMYHGTSSTIQIKVNNSENVPLHYKWEYTFAGKDDAEDFGEYDDVYWDGEDDLSYIEVNTLVVDYKYRCTVSDDMGNKEQVDIYVKCINTIQLVNSGIQQNISIKYGDTMTLKAEASSTKPDSQFTYKWTGEDEKILGTKQVYTKNNFGTDDAWIFYRCEVSDGYSIDWIVFYVGIDSGLIIDMPEYLEVENGETKTFSASVTTDMDKLDVEVSKYEPESNSWIRLEGIDLSRITVTGTEEIQVYLISADDGVNDEAGYTIIGPKALLNGTSGTPEKAKILNEGIEERAVILGDAESAYFKFVPKKAGKWTFYSTGVYDTGVSIYHSEPGDMEYDSEITGTTNFKITADLKANETYYIVTSFAGSNFNVFGSFKVKAELVSRMSCQHQWGTAVITKYATCTEDGMSVKRCTICGEEENTMISKTPHSFGAYTVVIQPTILSAGSQEHTCSVCGYQEMAEITKLQANVTLSANSLPLQVKQSVSLSKLIQSMTTGDKLVSCSSANKKIATVSNAGKVTGKKSGNVKITMNFASGVSKIVTVKVQKSKVGTTKITNVPSSIRLKVKKSYKLSPAISPITTKNKATYKTANKKIASVAKNGKIVAKKVGKTTITVKAGKKVKKVKVTVIK